MSKLSNFFYYQFFISFIFFVMKLIRENMLLYDSRYIKKFER